MSDKLDKIEGSINAVDKALNVGDRVLQFFNKYSIFQIIKAVILIIFLGYVVYFSLNPEIIYNGYKEWERKQHTESIEERLRATKQVNLELEKLLNNTNADRVFFIEFHNGNRSLEGNPFAFGQMCYEEVANHSYYISDEYNDFSLTKYKTVNYIYENLYFFGTIDELAVIDKRLAQKLEADGINHICLIQVEGIELPLGILGVTWNTEPLIYQKSLKNFIRQSSIKLSIHLNH
jgi:hypothetical protein